MIYTVVNGCDEDNRLHKQVIEKIGELLVPSKAETNWVQLHDHPLHYCRGCDYCQNVNPGFCSIDDGINDMLKKYINSDTVVILTPVQFGCCHSRVKNFIDRTEPLFLPYQVKKNGRTMMKARYTKYPELVFVGVKENGSEDCMKGFSESVQKSNLALASSKARTAVITKEADIDDLDGLMKEGQI